jgi:hypothetical protein
MSQLKGQTLQNESAKRQTLQVLQISLISSLKENSSINKNKILRICRCKLKGEILLKNAEKKLGNTLFCQQKVA